VIRVTPLSLFLLLGMHGWIDILAKRDGLGALHGWVGKGLKIACEGVCYSECLGGNLYCVYLLLTCLVPF
jgi:hypothetical protein